MKEWNNEIWILNPKREHKTRNAKLFKLQTRNL